MAYDIREGLKLKTDPRTGEDMNLPPKAQGTDPNEHRTRRHKYDTNLPPDRKHNRAPDDLVGDDKTHEQMLRWLSKDPTRLADAQRDVARWKEYLAVAVQNPVFPFFVSMAYGSKSLRP